MLSALIVIPLLGAILIGLLPRVSPSDAQAGAEVPDYSRAIALLAVTLTVFWSVLLGFKFDTSIAHLQFVETMPWIDALGLAYRLGLDGLSLPLLVINALLTWFAIYSTDESLQRPRLYYMLILLLNAGVAGAFLAQDLLLFFLFYEIELIPLYFLIAIWGGAQRGYAATKFLIYTAISGVLILAAFLGLTWLSGASSFEYDSSRSQFLPLTTQLILLGTLRLALGLRFPWFLSIPGYPTLTLRLQLRFQSCWQGFC